MVFLAALALSDISAQDNPVQHAAPKNGYHVILGKDRPESGIPPKGKVAEGNFRSGKKEGEWTLYHHDGKTPKVIGNYVNNLPSGDYRKYYENGILKEQGRFISNQNIDSLKRFYNNGNPEYLAFYNANGKEDGIVRFYHRNGKQELVYTAKDGAIISELQRYNEDGVLIDPINDSLNNPNKIYDTDLFLLKQKAPKLDNVNADGYSLVLDARGNKIQEGEFSEGFLYNGKRFVYNEDGILIEIEIYIHGYLHSYNQL